MTKEKICYGCMRKLNETEEHCKYCGFDEDAYMIYKDGNSLEPGEVLHGRYLVGKVLGIGGFGITYIGFDQILQIKIAIKEYFPSEYASRNTTHESQYFNEVRAIQSKEAFEAGLDRFLSEARVLARFNKMGGVVSVTDFFHENGTGYMIMEYLPGQSLKEIVLSKEKMMTEAEIKDLMLPVIDALYMIHKEGLIHRDISPDNLIMNSAGKLTLIDFGAARDVSEMGKSLTVVLKHGYAPIEQYTSMGAQGPWTDIYALCATMYYMITHAVPQTATDRVIDDRQMSLKQLGMPVSFEFSKTIQKGLEIHAKNRFASVDELKKSLYESKFNENQPIDIKSEYGWEVPKEQLQDEKESHPEENPKQAGMVKDENMEKKSSVWRRYAVYGAGFLCLLFFLCSAAFGIKSIMGDQKGEEGQQTEAVEQDMEELNGTYVTYKSVDLNHIPIYKEPGDLDPKGKIPEGKCVQMLGNKVYEGNIWYKIDYCGKTGWVQEDLVRFLSEEVIYFHIDEDTSKNIIFVNMEKIKLHTEPKTKSPYAAANIPYGTEFEVTELKNGWGKINYKGKICWIDMKVANYYATDYWQVEICNGSSDSINLRKKATGNSKSLIKIPVGTVLNVSEYKKGWGRVNYKGKTGWIKLHYATSCSSEGLSDSEDLN